MTALASDVSGIIFRGTHALSLYELTVIDGEFVVVKSPDDLPFNGSHYSEFKYGRRDIALEYGARLAGLLDVHLRNLARSDERIVVVGTPYKCLPNAAKMLAITAERHLRVRGLPTSYSCIYQHRLAEGDYGTLPAHLRDLRNKQKKRYLDPDDFAGTHVVVVDDVRITGSIERSILALLHDIPVLSVTIVNLVQLDQEIAQRYPHLENKLNHRSVKNVADVWRMMHDASNFTLTTRAIKFILESKLVSIEWLLSQMTNAQTALLYEAIVDEGYDQMSRYYEAFRLVQHAVI